MKTISSYIKLISSIIFITITLSSCRVYTYENILPTLSDGKYDTEFPYKTCSKQIGEIAQSVKKVHCIAEYKTYIFQEAAEVSLNQLTKKFLRQKNIIKKFDSESVIGTATVIYHADGRIALLSSAHVVNYPDTIIRYYEDERKNKTEFIQSFSIKTQQLNYVRDLPISENLEILALDSDLDIALLGQKEDETMGKEVHVFDYPLGDSDELEWGSFVYIMGFPSGYQMITRGIVSIPGGAHKKNFLIDALFNKGISGGIVLAIKDGVPNFELVGMAKSVAASYENVLIPEEESYLKKYNPTMTYEGSIFVKVRKQINYGITYSIASNSIKDFMQQHKHELEEKGYFIKQFLQAPINKKE